MSALTGNSVGSSYQGLLKTTDNAALNTNLKNIEDGLGNASPLSMATNYVQLQAPTIELIESTGGTNLMMIDATQTYFEGNVDFTNATVTGIGGGGSTAFGFDTAISNRNYGPQWDYYAPTGSTLAGYGRRVIGYTAFLPAGTYDQYNHWVRTAPATAGATMSYGLYNVDKTFSLSDALSFKPTTLVAGSAVSGVDVTTTGQKLVNLASPITLTAGYYFFATLFDNGVDNTFEGQYAGFKNTPDAKLALMPSQMGAPTPYQYASCILPSDALINQSAYYTSLPADMTADTNLNNTSFRLAFTTVAQ